MSPVHFLYRGTTVPTLLHNSNNWTFLPDGRKLCADRAVAISGLHDNSLRLEAGQLSVSILFIPSLRSQILELMFLVIGHRSGDQQVDLLNFFLPRMGH